MYVAIPYQGLVRKARIFTFTFCGRQFIKKDQSRILNFIDQMNGVQVTNFHNRLTEPLNYRIYARSQSIKQARRPEFFKYIDMSHCNNCHAHGPRVVTKAYFLFECVACC